MTRKPSTKWGKPPVDTRAKRENSAAVNRATLKLLLVKHEGLSLKPYRCPAGKLTIGVGRNLDDRGISEDEAAMLLDNDIRFVSKELSRVLPGFTSLDETRQNVLMDMCFNLGTAGLLKFKAMLAAVGARDFDRAAAEMLNSAWARQVGERARTLAVMLKGSDAPPWHGYVSRSAASDEP